MEIFSRRLQDTKKSKRICARKISGVSLSKLSRVWRLFMTPTFSTEIWKVPIYFWTKMGLPNSAIWMFPRLPSEVFFTLKLVRLIMLVPKFGATNLTTWRATFGHLAASCTSQSRLGHPLELTTWQASIGRCFGASTLVSQNTFPAN